MAGIAIDEDFDDSILLNLRTEADQILPIQTQSDRENPQISLWRAVITQALQDAGSRSKKREDKLDKAHAIAWLHSDSDDFREVCEYAELDPSQVKKKAKEAIKRGCKWKRDAGYKRFLLQIKRPRGRPKKLSASC